MPGTATFHKKNPEREDIFRGKVLIDSSTVQGTGLPNISATSVCSLPDAWV